MPRQSLHVPLPSAEERERHYRTLRAAFAVAYMSNAKWRKLFTVIAASGLVLDRAEWKLIDADQLYAWGVPSQTDLLPNRLADGRFAPVEYKWIEWIRFPRHYRRDPQARRLIEQDLDGLLQALATVGQLHIEREPDHLTVFGYGQ